MYLFYCFATAWRLYAIYAIYAIYATYAIYAIYATYAIYAIYAICSLNFCATIFFLLIFHLIKCFFKVHFTFETEFVSSYINLKASVDLIG